MTFAEEFRPDVSESEIAIFQQKKCRHQKQSFWEAERNGTIELGRN